MATKEQLDFFKLLFDIEDTRYARLLDRGKTFVSLATLYAAFLTVTIDKLHDEAIVTRLLFSLTTAAMLGSFLLSILAIGIYKYEMINTPEGIIEHFGDIVPTNEEFFDDRIVDLTVACSRNRGKNDKRARFLFWSSVCLLVGLCFHGAYFLTR